MSYEKKIKELNITLPEAKAPVGNYVAAKISGKMLFISGQISIDENGQLIKGKIGKDLDTTAGYNAAKRCALSIIAQVKKACDDDLSKISAQGFEIIQSSTPLFAREKLKDLLTYIFSVEKLNMKDLVAILKDIKRQFKLANTDQISFSRKVNNYQKYITNDYDEFEIALRCPIGVRAAGYHNYLLKNNVSMKGKYQPLGNGEKCKMYFTTDPVSNVFAYAPGERPYEFAPDVDYDTQFEKAILDPINRVIQAMGFKALNRNLIYTSAVF